MLLQDSNGDAVVDSVAGRIVVPDSARAAGAIAATNLAARLGYEAVAADLEPTVRRSELEMPAKRPVVLVGRAGTSETGALPGGPLGPGQGRIAVLPPSDRYRRGGLRIAGGDALPASRLSFLTAKSKSVTTMKIVMTPI